MIRLMTTAAATAIPAALNPRVRRSLRAMGIRSLLLQSSRLSFPLLVRSGRSEITRYHCNPVRRERVPREPARPPRALIGSSRVQEGLAALPECGHGPLRVKVYPALCTPAVGRACTPASALPARLQPRPRSVMSDPKLQLTRRTPRARRTIGYETPCLYADRTARRHRHHRHPGRDPVPGLRPGPREGRQATCATPTCGRSGWRS